MSSPASPSDARPHHAPSSPGYLTFGRKVASACSSSTNSIRRPFHTAEQASVAASSSVTGTSRRRRAHHLLHFRRSSSPTRPNPNQDRSTSFNNVDPNHATRTYPPAAMTAQASSSAVLATSDLNSGETNLNKNNGINNTNGDTIHSVPLTFLQSPAAIPPRTSSVQSTPGAAAATTETDWLSGHKRQRSRKVSNGAGLGNNTNTNSTMPTPPDPSRFATEDFFLHTRRPWPDEKNKVLTGPFDYLNNHPGKDFRSALVKAFDAWLEVPPESLAIITRVISMLHTASLLVDDVEDNSQLRRGLPVAHSIFGTAQTINSSNYIYFCALQELQKLRNPKAVTIFTEELLHLHRGQGMDLFWRDTLTCPTEDDYLEMVGNKTGGLFRLGIKLMQAESRSLVDCVPLVNVIGLVFQIADDYRNLSSTEYAANKGMCEDLTEGKFSFPVIHSIRSAPGNMQLLNILRQKTENEEVKRYAVKYMESTGSFAYTREVLAVLIARARRMADEVDEGLGRAVGIHRILDRIEVKEGEGEGIWGEASEGGEGGRKGGGEK